MSQFVFSDESKEAVQRFVWWEKRMRRETGVRAVDACVVELQKIAVQAMRAILADNPDMRHDQ